MNISWPFPSSKLDFTVIKTLERHSLNVNKCQSNVLITGESNFDEGNGQKMLELIRVLKNNNFLRITAILQVCK